MPKFSIIIPTVKQTFMVRDCINAFKRHETLAGDCEILVVDDGSSKEVQDWLKRWAADEPQVRLFLKAKNSGFSHTVNVGLQNATGDYLVLLNNDVTFIGRVLQHIEAAFQKDNQIGVVGCKLLYPDMKVQHAGVIRMPRSTTFLHVNKQMPRESPAVNRSRYFLSVTGALFAIRRLAYEVIGPFNENYFLSCEDTEYCLRAWKAGWRVYYTHDAEAIHAEGGTRGNDERSKIKKGPEWFLKERETWAKFAADLRKYDTDRYDEAVSRLNSGKPLAASVPSPSSGAGEIKVEIGSGYMPQPGYKHLDVREGLPQLDYVCDFSKDPLPFADGEIAEVMSNHVIEHVSWRKLPFVLGEWFRVLKPGGRVFFRTPDLEFIARTYLQGKTTPEHPNDEGFITKHLASVVTPAWWANIKLFAGQDYPSNFHFLCFDFDMAKQLLERFGFESVRRVDVHPVFSPGELQIEAFKPGAVAATSPVRTRVLIRRKGALGDVLLTTPIARRIREELGRDAVINVATDCGVVYQNNPCVDGVFPGSHTGDYDRVIDLDLAYESDPKQHIIEAYSKVAFGDSDYDKTTSFSPTELEVQGVERRLAESGIDTTRAVVIHMAQTWKNRTWPAEYWRQTIEKLIAAGVTVIQVGSANDIGFAERPNLHNWLGKITLHQIAALVARVGVFAGNDSGLIHIAGTTDARIVGIFTSALAAYRVPFREGRYGHNVTAIEPSIDCRGCLHREPPPVVYCDCRRGDFACLALITPQRVGDAILEAMQ